MKIVLTNIVSGIGLLFTFTHISYYLGILVMISALILNVKNIYDKFKKPKK